VLGVIQGLTEFIPVSSTAHLILAQSFSTGLTPNHAHTFDTFIQLGTVIPVLIYFWRDWLRLLAAAGRLLRQRRVNKDQDEQMAQDERMVIYLILGSLPAGILGLLLESKIEKLAEPGNKTAYLLIGLALIVVGGVMYVAERTGSKVRTLDHLRGPDALVIGFAQALALFPGVSRSGATMTAGLFAGFTREAAARYSFMLMTPIMLAATGYKFLKVVTGKEPMDNSEIGSMLLAAVVAGITGYVAIAFLLNWLRTRSLGFFAVYRLLAGGFALCLYFFQ